MDRHLNSDTHWHTGFIAPHHSARGCRTPLDGEGQDLVGAVATTLVEKQLIEVREGYRPAGVAVDLVVSAAGLLLGKADGCFLRDVIVVPDPQGYRRWLAGEVCEVHLVDRQAETATRRILESEG